MQGLHWPGGKADHEDKERRRLACVWVAFVGLVRQDSELLLELEDCSQERLLPLLLDRAPATLKAHLRGWRTWIGFCASLSWKPGKPSMEQMLDFLASLAEGSSTNRGSGRVRSANSLLRGVRFAAFKFQLVKLDTIAQSPLVSAWLAQDCWKPQRVKESLPLPLIVVLRLKTAVLGDPGDDKLLLCAVLTMHGVGESTVVRYTTDDLEFSSAR